MTVEENKRGQDVICHMVKEIAKTKGVKVKVYARSAKTKSVRGWTYR
jgi:hypothetical protein